MGLEPGTTRLTFVVALERWNEGDNGILAFCGAYLLVRVRVAD